MLEIISDLPANVVGIRAIGTVTKDDYVRVIEPLLDQARREGRQLRFLYQFGPEFERFSPGAAWEDARIGLTSMRRFEACAVVTDIGWISQAVHVIRLMMPCPVHTYANSELAAAADWLASLPEPGHMTHELLREQGVMVVEPHGRLRAADFDALSLVVDPWIAAHGQLHGFVVHTRDFPGWEGLGGLMRHVKFVHDHHRKIGRVAVATDTKLADLGPQLSEHFVEAKLRHFGYDELEQAIAWAAEGDASHAQAGSPAPV